LNDSQCPNPLLPIVEKEGTRGDQVPKSEKGGIDYNGGVRYGLGEVSLKRKEWLSTLLLS